MTAARILALLAGYWNAAIACLCAMLGAPAGAAVAITLAIGSFSAYLWLVERD